MKRIQTALVVNLAAASSLTLHAACRAVFAIALILALTHSAGAATVTKAAAGTDLTLAASWSPGVPTSADTATWSGTSLGTGLTLGSAGSWLGISAPSGAPAIDITGAGTLTLGSGGIVINTAANNVSVANDIVLGATQTWNVGASRTLTASGIISGSTFGITKSGSGILTLSGTASTFSGPLVFNAGTAIFTTAPNGTSSSLGNPSSISFGANSATILQTAVGAGNVTLSTPSTITVNGTASYSAKNGDAAGTIFETSAKITGSTGRVRTASPTTSGAIVRFSNDTSDYGGTFTAAAGVVEYTSVANGEVASSLGAGLGAYVLANGASALRMRYVGSANTATTRGFDWQASTGALLLDNTGAGSVKYLATGNLKSGGGNSTLTLDGSNAGENELAQVINNSGGVTAVTKNGVGTWILSGANIYSGATTINTGTLRVNGSLSSLSAVAVTSATLGGTGTIGGVVTVAAGGTIAAGASIGTLTFSSAVTLNGTVVAEIANGPSADLVNFVGGATLNSGSTLTVLANGGLTSGQTFNLFDGSLSGTFTTLNLPGGPGHWNTSALYSNGEITFANANPSAPTIGLTVGQGESVTFTFAGSKYPITPDVDGDAITVTTTGGSPTLGTAGFTPGTVSYTSTGAAGADSFTYTVSDGLGGTATGTVNVQVLTAGNGANITGITVTLPTATVTALGIPGAIYSLQYTDTLTPVNWQDIAGNVTANGTGGITLTDPAAANPGPRYYRTKYVSGP